MNEHWSDFHKGTLTPIHCRRSIDSPDKVRAAGLKVGDVIVGRESSIPITHTHHAWWSELRMTLRYLGSTVCVWDAERRSHERPEFRSVGERSSTTDYRDWYLFEPDGVDGTA